MSDSEYIGSELEIFQHAVNWKRYYGSTLQPYLGSEVLEVGAGIGSTTEALVTERQTKWICLEPDASLVSSIDEKVADGRLPEFCKARTGTILDLAKDELFDSVIYIDVLEHIENDADELSRAIQHVRTGGHLVVLSPAHQFLYTPFDKAIGHFRRYSKRGIEELLVDPHALLVRSYYLDSVGTLASLANRLLLRQAEPTHAQIKLWDSRMVPLSRIADRIFGNKLGKSIVAVWRKTDG